MSEGAKRKKQQQQEDAPGKRKKVSRSGLHSAVLAAQKECDLTAGIAALTAHVAAGTAAGLQGAVGQLLSLACTALQSGKASAEEALAAGEELLKVGRGHSALSESSYSNAVRLYAHAGRLDAARELLRELQRSSKAGKGFKLRWVLPILECAAAAGETALCEAVFSEVARPHMTADLLTYAEERQWSSICVCRLNAALRGPDHLRAPTVAAALSDLAATREAVHAEEGLVEAVRRVGERLGWRVEGTTLDDRGRCARTGRVLERHRLTDGESRRLLRLIERLVLDGAADDSAGHWRWVRRWLRQKGGGWDAIIDAANVGHSGQNVDGGMFSFTQIREVVDELVRAGRRPLVVLRSRWFYPGKDLRLAKGKGGPKWKRAPLGAAPVDQQLQEQLCGGGGGGEEEEAEDADGGDCDDESWERDAEPTGDAPWAEDWTGWQPKEGRWNQPADMRSTISALRQKWRDERQLLEAPMSMNDDWVILFVAVGMALRGVADPQLITNDQFRDHLWRVRGSSEEDGRLLSRWMKMHVTRYGLRKQAPPVLTPPPQHTIRPQVVGGVWFLPVACGERREEARHDGAEPEIGEVAWTVAGPASEFAS